MTSAAATTEQPEVDAAPPTKARKPKRPRPSLPTVSGRVAAAVTGLVVGVLAVLLTWLAQQGCDLALGTSSCGKPGFFALAAILVMIFFAWIIAAWAIYAATLPVATHLVLTEVDLDVEGCDAFFPDYDAADWVETRRARGEDVEWVWLERAP